MARNSLPYSQVLTSLKGYFAYHPSIAHALGSVNAAIFTAYFLNWHGKGRDKEGYIYKTMPEITRDTGLSERNIESARALLRELGILQELRKGRPCKVHYLFNWPVLDELLYEYLEENDESEEEQHSDDSAKRPIKIARNAPSSRDETHQLDSTKRPNQLGQNAPTYTTNTTTNQTTNHQQPPAAPPPGAGEDLFGQPKTVPKPDKIKTAGKLAHQKMIDRYSDFVISLKQKPLLSPQQIGNFARSKKFLLETILEGYAQTGQPEPEAHELADETYRIWAAVFDNWGWQSRWQQDKFTLTQINTSFPTILKVYQDAAANPERANTNRRTGNNPVPTPEEIGRAEDILDKHLNRRYG